MIKNIILILACTPKEITYGKTKVNYQRTISEKKI